MLTLFKKNQIDLYKKVEEIHNETYSLSEKIVSDIHEKKSSLEKEMNQINEKIKLVRDNLSGGKISDIEKLKSIGFTSLQEVVNLDEEKKRLAVFSEELNKLLIKESKEEKKLEAYHRFYEWFPTNKLLLVKDVNHILSKYGLSIGKIESYIGEIPDRNKKEIIQFNEQNQFRPYVSSYYFYNAMQIYGSNNYSQNLKDSIEQCKWKYSGANNVRESVEELLKNLKTNNFGYLIIGNADMFISGESYFSIEKFFESKMNGLRLNKKFPDPILLFPVVLNDTNDVLEIDGKISHDAREVNVSLKLNYDNIGFLVVSKWGNEKNIGEVQNESMN